ncbi:hypothetical protein [Phycicoccus sp. DTK01]|uniref:hypothetical protein n=1 Tax=Phycicoccus sp. DTK01 TaxID=2785745 RepID=UPI001A905901|nr:hypothetical protein [Phycicoccus sp. DTK01]GIL34739.1 hypothetical protein PDTK01_08150 [Phycicoccus sp. DTK01]
MTLPAHRRLLALVLACLLTGAWAAAWPASAEASAPAVSGGEADRGIQVPGKLTGLRSEGSAQGALADGRYLTYFVNNGGAGLSARFFAMDLQGSLVAEVAVPQGTTINSVAYSPVSRTVFFAANSPTYTYLYEWDGAALTKRTSIAGQTVLHTVAAPDGGVYLGTFAPSNGRLYRWVGGRLTDLGQPMAGESYVRSLAVDTTAVWVSNYRDSAAKLVRVDRATGARTAMATPSSFSSQWAAFDMSRAGDYLFLRTVNDPRLFAFNTVTRTFATFDDQVARVRTVPETPNPKPYIDGVSPYTVSPLVDGRYVFFQRSGAGVMRIDLRSGLKAIRMDKWSASDNTTQWPSASIPGPVSWAWMTGVPGRTGSALVATTIDGRVVVNGPGQTAPSTLVLPARSAPSVINRLGTDAAGNVLSGGFDLPTGIGRFDVTSGATSLLTGPQIEGFGRFDGSTVMGGYTGNASSSAPLYLWSGTGQPQLKTYLNNSQERPVAITQVGSKVAIGSIPIKNTLGGALSLWDPKANTLTVKRNLVANHSIVSLVGRGGLVVGGTSNAGGTGSTPTATSGRLFTYNTATGALKSIAPPRATTATYSWVAAITPDPVAADRYWAISTGYLVQFRVASDGSITVTRNLGGFPGTSSPTGKELGIEFVDGVMFATVGGGLSAINPATGEQTVVAPKNADGPVTGLVKAGTNRLFYARGARLFEYRVSTVSALAQMEAPVVTAPDVATSVAPGAVTFEGTATRNATITVTDGTRTRSTSVQDDGTWSVAPMDFASGRYQVTVTATMADVPSRSSTVPVVVATPTAEACDWPAPTVTNLVADGYNAPNADYAFEGQGTPGTVVTMVSGTRTRSATVKDDGTWAMAPVFFGWWAGSVPFTASFPGCRDVTRTVDAWFATPPAAHVRPLLVSHTATDWYDGGSTVFKGKGTPGALVTLIVGNQTRLAAVSTTGRWTMRAVTIGSAPVAMTLHSTVPGFEDQEAAVEVHFGSAPASLTAPVVTSPASGSSVAAGALVVSGKGTPRARVALTVAGRSVSTFVRDTGRWDLPPVSLTVGRWDLRVVASSPGLPDAVSTTSVSVSG